MIFTPKAGDNLLQMAKTGLGPLMIDVEGIMLTRADRSRLEHPLVGGVVLFSRNFNDRLQLANLVSQIKATRTPELLVATDHEGGRVQRFRNGFTRLPAARVIGELFDEDSGRAKDLARTLGRVTGAELRDAGIDINFAPVLDLFRPDSKVIGDRSYHKSPDIVASLGAQLVKGMRETGVHGVAKHFPGHGGVPEDSHHCLPVDDRSLDTMSESDLAPYRMLDRNALEGIMTCHVLFPVIDSLPATFSRRWIKGYLRGKLGFKGAVFSDDIVMTGAQGIGTPPARARQALDAGCDMVLVCNDPDAVDAILTAEALSHDKESTQRLEKLYGIQDAPSPTAQELKSWVAALEAVTPVTPAS